MEPFQGLAAIYLCIVRGEVLASAVDTELEL